MTSESLRFINAVIGFCTPMRTWPHPLAELGYEACGIEREIVVDLGGKSGRVVVDLICAASGRDHAICAETKSRTVHPEQVQRYRAMTSANLVNMANLPTKISPMRLTHDVIYMTSHENAEEVAGQLNEGSPPLAVLGCGEPSFSLYQGPISDVKLFEIFDKGIEIRPGIHEWPLTFVPFTAESPEKDIVVALAQQLSSFLISGLDFSVEDLAKRMLTNWDWFGAAEKKKLKAKFCALVDSAMKLELGEYYQRPTKHQAWKVLKGKLQAPHQTLRLAERVTDFVTRIEQDVPAQKGLEGPFRER